MIEVTLLERYDRHFTMLKTKIIDDSNFCLVELLIEPLSRAVSMTRRSSR